MVIFGGYTHRHNKEEICYDNQLYLYHLGCHTWISNDILGPIDAGKLHFVLLILKYFSHAWE